MIITDVEFSLLIRQNFESLLKYYGFHLNKEAKWLLIYKNIIKITFSYDHLYYAISMSFSPSTLLDDLGRYTDSFERTTRETIYPDVHCYQAPAIVEHTKDTIDEWKDKNHIGFKNVKSIEDIKTFITDLQHFFKSDSGKKILLQDMDTMNMRNYCVEEKNIRFNNLFMTKNHLPYLDAYIANGEKDKFLQLINTYRITYFSAFYKEKYYEYLNELSDNTLYAAFQSTNIEADIEFSLLIKQNFESLLKYYGFHLKKETKHTLIYKKIVEITFSYEHLHQLFKMAISSSTLVHDLPGIFISLDEQTITDLKYPKPINTKVINQYIKDVNEFFQSDLGKRILLQDMHTVNTLDYAAVKREIFCSNFFMTKDYLSRLDTFISNEEKHKYIESINVIGVKHFSDFYKEKYYEYLSEIPR